MRRAGFGKGIKANSYNFISMAKDWSWEEN